MTREEKKVYMKAYNKAYRLANKEKLAAQKKKYHEDNKELFSLKKKQKYEANKEPAIKRAKKWYKANKDLVKERRDAKTDDFYTLYFIPNHNYVGVTNQTYARMNNHRVKNNKDTTNWTTIKTFKTKREALDAESFYHSIGYEGCGRKNQLKKNPII